MASENENKHVKMLGESLAQLYETGTYSDFVITCGNDTYHVHKAIVCPRSSFFTAACNLNFKEGQEGKIDLPDDDPEAVREMVYYLYHLDLKGHDFIPEDGNFFEEELSATEYDDNFKRILEAHGYRFVGRRRVEDEVLKLGALIGTPSNLCLFAKAYALGEKYGIPGLKEIALKKFELLTEGYPKTEDFRLAVEEVYTSTIDQGRGLRDVLVSTVEKNFRLLNDQAFEAVVKNSELGHDLLMKITSRLRSVTRENLLYMYLNSSTMGDHMDYRQEGGRPPLFGTSESCHEYLKDLPGMLKTGKYSDLTIICGNNRYRVHRNILCARSRFFDVAYDGGFKESGGEIKLPDDDPAAYDAEERYRMRLFGAEFVGRKRIKQLKEREWESWKVEEPPLSSQLCLHAKVYALGEKYRMEGLKRAAKGKFESEIQSGNVGVDDFAEAVEEVYTSTASEDRGLRDVVANMIEQDILLLDHVVVQEVMRATDFALDVLLYMSQGMGSQARFKDSPQTLSLRIWGP
ncbi:hypothetical protein FGADI_11302 [Fusarium gaditjirri]|uniref:BTB domain-containing protein n=1 Tax=Fusarium gaditjirri TaxID=282569 RepID=A0A8H4WQF2_9HYPO|nr:hypothetical protein FGADI_11302 [Fusarium gaditjirri]